MPGELSAEAMKQSLWHRKKAKQVLSLAHAADLSPETLLLLLLLLQTVADLSHC